MGRGKGSGPSSCWGPITKSGIGLAPEGFPAITLNPRLADGAQIHILLLWPINRKVGRSQIKASYKRATNTVITVANVKSPSSMIGNNFYEGYSMAASAIIRMSFGSGAKPIYRYVPIGINLRNQILLLTARDILSMRTPHFLVASSLALLPV